ncbi:MAG: SurA N-terminal domain-containing protein, partial [Chloroflexota bacterium]|nr:SurA N-terminal domain-containing protein [Chloroflexota bacterium]
MVRRPEQPRRDRRLQSRREQERKKQRLIITVGVVIVVLALAIPAFGYYTSFIRPPRTVAAKVGNTTYTMGDLVKKLRVLQAQGIFAQNPQAIASAPMETLYNTVQDDLIRQGALKLGITVHPDEVQQVVRLNFYPQVPEGQQVEQSQLQKEYEEKLRSFLTRTTLSRKEFEKTIEYSLFKDKLREQLGKQVPSVADQVEVHWIRVENAQEALAAQERFKKGEAFATVASTVNTEAVYANKEGYVGWVPKGAFRELDKALFSIERNKVSEPIT